MRLWRVSLSTRVLLLLAPLGSALVGVALVVLIAKGPFGGGEPEEEVVVPPTATAPRITPVPAAPPSEAPAIRLVMPAIDVDAPLESLATQQDGVMPIPSGPEVVALYDMSAYHPGEEHRIGFGGNAIFSGHVDYIRYGPAVFWDLSELEPGDEAQVYLDDGTVYRYAVVWNERWAQEEIPWERIFEVNGHDAVTFITCAGSWDGSEYSDRRAVRAERVYGPFVEQAR
jgi:hypothetical protein